MGDQDLSDLWLEGDDGLTSVIADMPPRPAKGYVAVPLAWLARVLPVVRIPTHLVVALLI